MDDAGSLGAAGAKFMDMGHHVVAHLPLPGGHGHIVDGVLRVGQQGFRLGLGHGQAQFILRPGQLGP